ncbi:MAG: ATP-binding protein [Syntrophales bacterium]|nr:ATP-binding protein [Syntrophales bacterium]
MDGNRTALRGLKLRQTNIIEIVRASVLALPKTDSVRISISSVLTDESVWVDHERITKVLVDLEINAIEAMPGGGSLTIDVAGSEDQVLISIQDTGSGISKENMDHLFTPFFTTKPIGEGTGLGIPAAYGVIKSHGGDLAIESNADPNDGPMGTTIRIRLPRHLIIHNSLASLIIHEN